MDKNEMKITLVLSKTAHRRMAMNRTVPAVQYTPVVMGKGNTFTALEPVIVPYGWSAKEKEEYCKVHNCFIGITKSVSLNMSISAVRWAEYAEIDSVEDVTADEN